MRTDKQGKYVKYDDASCTIINTCAFQHRAVATPRFFFYRKLGKLVSESTVISIKKSCTKQMKIILTNFLPVVLSRLTTIN